ncbi:hypothetical protein BP5796_02948 [Coleophoma crateriformis]|uniref:Uncharacterized protein n=1 Tax=Coleophoma crateriformis TaxID=565419 RepID=A0A3D8SM44_9HELO|nr:hypothetical protein BP5796_02948 [Coleophoma crateriformis]
MLFSSVASALLATIPLVAADFHFGHVDYTVTTATGRYYMVLPASETSCLAAYDFYPKAAYGFTAPTQPLVVDICGKEIALNTTSGEWYTHGRVIESGVCNKIMNGTGTRTPLCQTAAFQSTASYLDLLSCPSDICS